MSGNPAPGTTGVFSSFSYPVLDGAAGVGFTGNLATGVGNVTTTNNRGIWGSNGSGGVQLVARTGSTAPGTATTFTSFGSALTDGQGHVAFQGYLPTTTSGSTTTLHNGIWRTEPASGAALVVQTGDAAAGTSGTFSDFRYLTVDPAGDLAFRGQTMTSSTTAGPIGIWVAAAGAGPQAVALSGAVAPGTSSAFADFDLPILNAGAVAFHGYLADQSEGIWGPAGTGSLQLFAHTGDAAPGTTGVFYTLGQPALNGSGQLAFKASLQDGIGGVTSANDQGIWGAGTAGGIRLVARSGGAAAGTSGIFQGAFSSPSLNDAGQLAFHGFLVDGVGGITGSNDEGIWLTDSAGNIQLVAQTGEVVAGALGVSFGLLQSDPAINGNGDVAFFADLTNTATGSAAGRGIFVRESNGTLVTMVRTGDQLQVAPGIYKTVSALSFYSAVGTDVPGYQRFNDAGRLVFTASFSDGTQGVMLASLPEPNLAGLLAVALAVLALRQRRECPAHP